jgi:hypothetical protein
VPDFSSPLAAKHALILDVERDIIDKRTTFVFFDTPVGRPADRYWACVGVDYPVEYNPRDIDGIPRIALFSSRARGLDGSAAVFGVSSKRRGRFDGYDDYVQYALDGDAPEEIDRLVAYNYNSTEVGGLDLHIFPIVSECDPCNEPLSEKAPGLGRLTHNLCGECPHIDDTTPGECICEYYIQPVHVCDERLDDGTCVSTYTYISDFGADGPAALHVPAGTEQNSVCGREPLVGCGFEEPIVIEDDLSQATIDTFVNTHGELASDTFKVHWDCGTPREHLEWRVADLYSQQIAQTNGVPVGGLCADGVC